jgi:type VI secretion system protein ImpG
VSDSLLGYFNRELDALRGLASEFAEKHPKIAGRLRLTKDAVDDPHVARLLEGVAFLGARVQHRLDDEFPELTDALLSVLYPHYLAPLPSVAIVRFDADPGMIGPARLPSGLAVEAEPLGGEACLFRTAYPLTLWPLEIEAVKLSGMPLPAPPNPAATRAVACLRISLRCANPQMTFTQLGLDQLRFFLAGEQGALLLELLLAHTVSVALADDQNDAHPVILPPDAVQAVGFAPEEALFPWPARSFSGFRLLSEYFTAREKFLFVDIRRLDAKTLVSAGNRMDIFVYLDRMVPDLERSLQANSLALGCTPIVNLFEQRCEPISLDHTRIEYRIEPDARRPASLEIWSVERVRESLPGGEFRPWSPFHRLTRTHGTDAAEQKVGGFYGIARRDIVGGIGGTDVLLLPHDAAFDPEQDGGGVLSIDALCCNRDLPASLPFGGGRPTLRLIEGAAAVTGLMCLTAPTPTLRLPLQERGAWRLISHLSLGHLSVVGGEAAADALREVLRLYDCRESSESRAAIRALINVTSSFGDQLWATGGLYVLASVLDRFLALHATVNSFVRTRVVLRGHSEVVASWPPRAGSQVLL